MWLILCLLTNSAIWQKETPYNVKKTRFAKVETTFEAFDVAAYLFVDMQNMRTRKRDLHVCHAFGVFRPVWSFRKL